MTAKEGRKKGFEEVWLVLGAEGGEPGKESHSTPPRKKRQRTVSKGCGFECCESYRFQRDPCWHFFQVLSYADTVFSANSWEDALTQEGEMFCLDEQNPDCPENILRDYFKNMFNQITPANHNNIFQKKFSENFF